MYWVRTALWEILSNSYFVVFPSPFLLSYCKPPFLQHRSQWGPCTSGSCDLLILYCQAKESARIQKAVVLFLLNTETDLQNVDSYKLFRPGLFYKQYAGDQLLIFFVSMNVYFTSDITTLSKMR